MKTKFMNENEFIAFINNIKGCQFATLAYVANVESINKKLVGGKKNPYHNQVTSTTTISGSQIGANYENAVNNRLQDGEEFTAEQLPWGEWMRPNYLITHKGATYLRAYKTRASKTEKAYYVKGVKADEKTAKDIANNIRESGGSTRQSAVGIEDERQVKPFNINIANIISVAVSGEVITITH